MTRKLLLTAAIVALAFAPSIGTGTAQAYGFYGGGFGRGFHGGFGRGFYGGFGLSRLLCIIGRLGIWDSVSRGCFP
jgi:hypothetical protein